MASMGDPDARGSAFPLRRHVILASSSASRIALLENAGVPFETIPPAVDEDEAKSALKAEGADAAALAAALADLKAESVARRWPERLVIGADQVLVCDGEFYDKPPDRAAARHQLLALRGRMHVLATAVCVWQGTTRQWGQVESAQLWMRPFSDAFLDRYLARAGDEVLGSVGAYRIEGLGVQLFSRIEGDWFAILGLPLLPLLDHLRAQGALAA